MNDRFAYRQRLLRVDLRPLRQADIFQARKSRRTAESCHSQQFTCSLPHIEGHQRHCHKVALTLRSLLPATST